MKDIKIAVAEDHAMFRSGLVSMLNGIQGIHVVVEASNGKELMSKIRGMEIDVIFLDCRMPELNGIDTAKLIRKRDHETKILMLSAYDEEGLIKYAFANGANGYLIKDDEPKEIQLAIESVMSTGYYFNDRTSKMLVVDMALKEMAAPRFSSLDGDVEFSLNEIAVMRLLAKEHSTSEIAELMHKSDRTIDSYRASILKKTGAKNLAGIIMYGVRSGIIEVKPTKSQLD